MMIMIKIITNTTQTLFIVNCKNKFGIKSTLKCNVIFDDYSFKHYIH